MDRFVVVDANEDGVTWKYDDALHLVRYDYNDYKAGDDWLFLPSLHFEKGKEYKIAFSTQCRSMSAIESVEVTIGKSAAIEAQSPIADRLNVVWTSPKSTEYVFTVDETGDYRLAFHEVSAAAKYYLLLDDIKVAENVSAPLPGDVADVSVKPFEKGGLGADIAFSVPTADVDGNALGKSTVSVYRDDLRRNVKTFENVEPGSKLEFVDEVDKSGLYTYRFTVSTAAGDSKGVSREVYVGYDEPVAASGIKATADGKNVRLSWNAPAAGRHNGYVDEANLEYAVTRHGETEPFATVKTTELVDDKVSYGNGQQELGMYTVRPINNGIEGESATSNLVISGVPYKAPFDESFAYASTELYPWYSGNTYSGGEKYWDVRTYGVSPQTYAYDDDAGLLLFRSYAAPKGTTEYFLSPLFDISDMIHPIFVYHFYHSGNAGDLDNLTVEFAKNGGEFKAYGDPVVLGAHEAGWKEYYVELDDLKGSDFIQLGLAGHSECGHNIHVDKLALVDNCYDVKPVKLTVGSSVEINTEFPVTATISNAGNKTVDNVEVRLLRNGEVVQTRNIGSVEPATDRDVTFSVKESAMAAGADVAYAVETSAAQDEKPGNDVSDASIVSVATPRLPMASGLAAEAGGGKVTLSWQAAEPYANYLAATDDFESYTPFIIEGVGPWTMVDADKQKTSDWYIKYDHVDEPMAFQVFSTEKAEIESSDKDIFAAHSGSQYLISFINDDYSVKNDDWLISPEVVADKPVSFFAKTLSRGYKQSTLEVYCSATPNRDDFVLLSAESVPYNWTEFSYRLPSSARYFAVRNTSYDASALMIDDITYAPKDQEAAEEKPAGYNVYRDDELVTPTPVKECRFTDEVTGKHTYKVTALFSVGESAYAGPVEVDADATGIDPIAGNAAKVAFTGGKLVALGDNIGLVEVYSLDGKLVGRLAGGAKSTGVLAKGTYVVKCGGSARKLVNK